MDESPEADGPASSHGRPATIYEVAEAADASIASVSRVLRGDRRVSRALLSRVTAAIERLDYVPSSSARNLAVGRHHAFGLVLGDLTGTYFPPLALGFEAAAGDGGTSVVLQIAGSRSEPDLAARRLLSRVDGLAVGPSALPDVAVHRLARRVPVVLLGREPVKGCDAVLAESADSVAQLVAHLVAHGRRRLRFVGDVQGSWDARQRESAFRVACAAADLEPLPVLQTAQTEAGASTVADALVGEVRAGRIDGVVCVNDELALALMLRFRHSGVDVPGDVVVTGFDDVAAARHVQPSLTTVEQPVAALGREAAALLERRLATPGAEVAVRTLPTRLVIRDSCGAHPDWEADR